MSKRFWQERGGEGTETGEGQRERYEEVKQTGRQDDRRLEEETDGERRGCVGGTRES